VDETDAARQALNDPTLKWRLLLHAGKDRLFVRCYWGFNRKSKAAPERVAETTLFGVLRRLLFHSEEIDVRRQFSCGACGEQLLKIRGIAWLNEDVYRTKVQPRLLNITVSRIASTLGISWAYASNIQKGKVRPHPRHWVKLAELAAVTSEQNPNI
jgi:hypothetical protein